MDVLRISTSQRRQHAVTVCAQMWYLLQQRHLRYCIQHEHDLRQMMDTLRIQALRTASVHFHGNGDQSAKALAGLKEVLAAHSAFASLVKPCIWPHLDGS